MRFLLVIVFVLLAGCSGLDSSVGCSQLDLSRLTAKERYHAAELCKAVAERPEPTMVNRLGREARAADLPLDKFVETRIGQVALLKEVSSVIIGLVLVIGMWIGSILFIRAVTWEAESATRKGWGIFSIWTVTYRRRKEFGDLSPAGWIFFMLITSVLTGIAVYASIAT